MPRERSPFIPAASVAMLVVLQDTSGKGQEDRVDALKSILVFVSQFSSFPHFNSRIMVFTSLSLIYQGYHVRFRLLCMTAMKGYKCSCKLSEI